jgi:hypothetical protein
MEAAPSKAQIRGRQAVRGGYLRDLAGRLDDQGHLETVGGSNSCGSAKVRVALRRHFQISRAVGGILSRKTHNHAATCSFIVEPESPEWFVTRLR